MKRIFLLIFPLFLITACTSTSEKKVEKKKAALPPPQPFKGGAFIYTMAQDLPFKQNAMYTPLTLLMWEKSKNKVGLTYTISPDLLVRFNQDTHHTDVISSPYYGILLGYPTDTENKPEWAKDVVKEKYHREDYSDKQFLLMSCLVKKLQFNIPYNTYSDKIVFNGVRVKSFGTTSGKYDPYLEVLYYKDSSHFIFSLNNEKDYIVISMLPELEHMASFERQKNYIDSLIQLKALVEASIGKGDQQALHNFYDHYGFNEEDEFHMPIIDINQRMIISIFSDLKYNGMQLPDAAIHTLKFRLDEKGAVLEEMEYPAAAGLEPPPPKKMFVNKPFNLMMYEKGRANPYYAMWMENEFFMERVK